MLKSELTFDKLERNSLPCPHGAGMMVIAARGGVQQ